MQTLKESWHSCGVFCVCVFCVFFFLVKYTLRQKSLIRDKERHFKIMKDRIHEKDTVLNVNAPNSITSKSTLNQYAQKVNRHLNKYGIQMAYKRR